MRHDPKTETYETLCEAFMTPEQREAEARHKQAFSNSIPIVTPAQMEALRTGSKAGR